MFNFSAKLARSQSCVNTAELVFRSTQRLTCHPVLTEAPSFAEPGDSIIDRVASTKVVIPCPAEGTKSLNAESHAERKHIKRRTDRAVTKVLKS